MRQKQRHQNDFSYENSDEKRTPCWSKKKKKKKLVNRVVLHFCEGGGGGCRSAHVNTITESSIIRDILRTSSGVTNP